MDTFNIQTISWKPLLTLFALAVVPVILTFMALRVGKNPSAVKYAFIGLGVTFPVMALVIVQMAMVKVRMGETGLEVGGGMYHLSVPYGDIITDQVVMTGGGARPPKLGARTNGIGLPGLSIGWFRAEGRSVFAAYNGTDGSFFIPTRGGHDVLLSPDDAARFAAELTRRTGGNVSRPGP